MQQLINSRRVAVDAANSAGTTALQLAAAAPQGSVPCLRALVAAGASVAAVDGSGYTARQVATAAGNTAAALYLTAVEFTARAFPGRPTRSELLGTEGELAAIYQLACEADRAQEKVGRVCTGAGFLACSAS